MSNRQPKQENKQSLSYAFKQQVMKAWQPVPTLNSTICLFFVLSLFFLVMGIVLISYTDQIREHYQRYDALCQDSLGKECVVEIAIDKKFTQPVYIYYELTNFYQNHRRYVKSKSTSQLSGDDLSVSDLSDCDPVITNAQMGKNMSITNKTLTQSAAAIPCGLIAQSLFNDTYQLYKRTIDNDPLKTTRVTILETDIAWPSDRDGRYNNVNPDKQWTNMTNEHFMVWMRTAALPTFRKLWGRVEQDLEPGLYYYKIQNTYNVRQFDGQKALVLSTANAFGGKNTFLAIAYIVVGVICALITIGFLIRKLLSNQEDKNK